jgi:hypothetical protein
LIPVSDVDAHTQPIRVVIADDHSVVRRGLRQVLEAEGGFEIVAEAGDIDGARRYVISTPSTPRPCGSSPIARCVASRSRPAVTNRSSPVRR